MKTIQLNNEVLLNLYGDCEESKAEVFSEFLSSYYELKQNLFAAFEEENLESLKNLLHYHGPSFMYIGVPEVADRFKKLEAECNKVKDRVSISVDFFNLLQMVDETRMQVADQMQYFQKAS